MKQTTPLHITVESNLAETLAGIARHQSRPVSRVCSELLTQALTAKGVVIPEPIWPLAPVATGK